jgi:NADH-quinone oxidoreductase subunit E
VQVLTDEEKREIEHELTVYPYASAACVEALKIVQRNHGWVSDEHIKDIAAILGMTPEELDGVATFYNLIYRRPVGRNVILMCDSVSCWIMGYERMKQCVKEKLGIEPGQTTADGRFTVLPVPCLGTCDKAPAMMVGDDLHTNLAPESFGEKLEPYK